MSNFELIDDYLTNRLGEQERVSFEQELGSDPALKADVDLQKHIVAGAKKGRAGGLQAMRNNVPVEGGFSCGPLIRKVAARGDGGSHDFATAGHRSVAYVR